MSIWRVIEWRVIEIFLCLHSNVQAEMEGYIVGGEEVAIETYPHSAFLDVWCSAMNSSGWSCGSSIINQQFTLTAAHCLEYCTRNGYISVAVGSEHKHRGVISSAYRIKTHNKYNDFTFEADIGLVMLKTPLELGPKIQRVILMSNPPSENVAYVAGWGVVDEGNRTVTNLLKHAEQPLWSREKCRKLLGNIPDDSLCAGNESGKNNAAVGDAGCALVIQGHIQIGIVSFKIRHVSTSLVVYVNVSRFYDWVVNTTESLVCAE